MPFPPPQGAGLPAGPRSPITVADLLAAGMDVADMDRMRVRVEEPELPEGDRENGQVLFADGRGRVVVGWTLELRSRDLDVSWDYAPDEVVVLDDVRGWLEEQLEDARAAS